jgi:hypothetical protein
MTEIATARPALQPFLNAGTYSKKTVLYPGNCHVCGAGFVGTRDRAYCGDECRLTARRARLQEEKRTGQKPRHLISWAQRRFAVLERDSFKCRYCGRGAAEGAVLQVDHVRSASRGGPNTIANLVTACRDCNVGKGPHPLLDGRASEMVIGLLSGAG